LLAEVAKTEGLPLYVGEWNDVSREETENAEAQEVREINPSASDLNQTDALILTKKFTDIGVWGWAFWNWNFLLDANPDFNLITISTNGSIVTTKYFDILKKAIE